MQIAELRQCSDLDTLEKQLESLPKDLNETYDRILLRVQERDQSAVHNFLQWIAFSYRPLKLEELAEVAAVDWNAESGPKFELKRRYVDNRDILEKCSSLIAESEGEAGSTYRRASTVSDVVIRSASRRSDSQASALFRERISTF